MPIKRIELQPGIMRETTNYANRGGWYDGDKIRFRAGKPEKIGGWRKALDAKFDGSCRLMHEWQALDLNRFLFLGTHLKAYILWGSAYYDITPIRATHVLADPFRTDGGNRIIVTDMTGGLTPNDYVTYSGATDITNIMPPLERSEDGTPRSTIVPAAMLNQEFQVSEIIDDHHYVILLPEPHNTSGYVGGGPAVSAAYQVYTGLDVAVPGTGWGASPWGTPIGWGEGYSYRDNEGNLPYNQIRLWTADNYGEDLIYAIRGGQIFYWARNLGVDKRGVPLQSMAGALEAPHYAFVILISEGDRHVVAIGTNDLGQDTLDPLLVRWSDQENALDWEPRRNNSAGTYRLSSGSSLQGAVRTRQEVIIWTEKNMHSMRYIGPPYTFGFNLLAENVSLISPRGMINAGGRVFWMDRNSFYAYTGQVQELPCTVTDYVFSDFNMAQRAKIFACHNHNFNEVMWFYPSELSDEVDKYVAYQYVDNVWTYGTMERTAWLDLVWGGSYPVATSDGQLWHHEYGDDADTEPLPAWVESSDLDVEDGDKFAFLRRVIPDVQFRGDGSAQAVGLTLRARRAPGDFYIEKARAEITPYTKDCWVRARGREFSLRFESNSIGTGWRLGAFRIEVQPDGKR